jgi:hypothetical protein
MTSAFLNPTRNFTSFLPAISNDALYKASAQVRSWRLHRRTGHTFTELAHAINPIVRGWMQYYGAFYSSALHPLLKRINAYLLRWLRKSPVSREPHAGICGSRGVQLSPATRPG